WVASESALSVSGPASDLYRDRMGHGRDPMDDGRGGDSGGAERVVPSIVGLVSQRFCCVHGIAVRRIRESRGAGEKGDRRCESCQRWAACCRFSSRGDRGIAIEGLCRYVAYISVLQIRPTGGGRGADRGIDARTGNSFSDHAYASGDEPAQGGGV